MTSVTFNLKPLVLLTDDAFQTLCRANPDVKLERTAEGELVVVLPTGGTFGRKNRNLIGQFSNWVEENLALGEGFDSSTLFQLPNGAKLSPDASWVARRRWDVLTTQQQDGYPPLCPDFVVDLRSPTDSLEELQVKMQEYLNNGTQLGWLINPKGQQVEIYRQGQEKEILQAPTSLSGEQVLPGFMLSL